VEFLKSNNSRENDTVHNVLATDGIVVGRKVETLADDLESSINISVHKADNSELKYTYKSVVPFLRKGNYSEYSGRVILLSNSDILSK
jgi:hypothetical protein